MWKGWRVCAFIKVYLDCDAKGCYLDSGENVFRLGGLECRWEPGDVDVCPNGGVGTVVVRCGIRRERYVKRLCCGVRAEMEQWFDSHGSVRIEITC